MLKAYELPKFCPYTPVEKQIEFLSSDKLETLFGGAAGAGKSTALLMAATQYLHVPGYKAIILRRHFSDLVLPGALMEKADAWFRGKPGVEWSAKDRTWTFPSGAILKFSYLYKPHDHLRFASKTYHFIGFDELGMIKEKHYRYMFSRLRNPENLPVPLRAMSASHPTDNWVRTRFLETKDPDRTLISSNLLDNYHIDPREFIACFDALPPWERRRLLHGQRYDDRLINSP